MEGDNRAYFWFETSSYEFQNFFQKHVFRSLHIFFATDVSVVRESGNVGPMLGIIPRMISLPCLSIQ